MTAPESNVPTHILEAVLELSVATKGGRSDEATHRVFAKYLADLSPDQVKRAVTLWCLSSVFFPTPRELRGVLRQVPGLNASTAWEEACKAVSDHGSWGTPKWSHPAVGRAVVATCGSWRGFCESPTSDFVAKRAKFFSIFDGLAESAAELERNGVAAQMLEEPRKRIPDFYGANYLDPLPDEDAGPYVSPWADAVDPPQIDDIEAPA